LRNDSRSAEGCGKRSNGEFQRFLTIAAGSASELEYHFPLSRDLNMLDEPTIGSCMVAL